MALKTINEADLIGRGVQGLADVPGLPAHEMKRRFEEIVREVVIPAFNENAKRTFDKTEVQSALDNKVVEIGSSDMLKAVYDPSGYIAAQGGILTALIKTVDVVIAKRLGTKNVKWVTPNFP